ncbi:MAG: YjgN family protein [Verrucomicrobia bacterium]|nr:YjgN family protein [Verrucomicrobiota bacterium]MDA1067756.1 YjgN family protein [Verrucomicrobiota bacterium]
MANEPTDPINEPDDDDLKWAPPEYRPATPPPLQTPPTVLNPPKELETFRMSFTGNAGEYFRIWIVNLFLTIVTLGIYFPWAVVRQRKYLYANTWLGEDNFGFHANPIALLKGYIIVVIGALIYGLSSFIHPFAPLGVLAILGLSFPFLVWKAIRFRARYSSFRNIRFKFTGELGQAYVLYLCWALLIPFTAGLIVPYIEFLKKEYLIRNLSFGNQKFNFKGVGGAFYPPYLGAIGIGFLGYIAMAIFVFIPISLAQALALPENIREVFMVGTMIIGYLILLLAFAIGKSLIYSRIQNYSWGVTDIGFSTSFKSEYELKPLLVLDITNGLAIFFSLGLATPWATIRKKKYVVAHLLVNLDKDQLEKVEQAAMENEGALGDAAADYMDFDIG